MTQRRTLVFCNCAHYDVIPPEAKRQVFDRLCKSGVEFTAVADLCELAAKADPSLAALAEADDLRIAACFPRAVRWLFHAAGAELTEGTWRVANMRTQTPKQVGEVMLAGSQPDQSTEQTTYEALSATEGKWVPWFPVIDRVRCRNCKRCAEFCLFGVYALDDDGAVFVRNPTKCKTNCPACARLCPHGAIMFPKYDQRPINGDEVMPEDLQSGNMNVDLAELTGGDVLAKLRVRSRSAESGGLSEISRQLGIPQDVLGPLSAAADRQTADRCDCDPCDCSDDHCDPSSNCECDCNNCG